MVTRSAVLILVVLAVAPRAQAAGASFTPVSLRIPVQEIGLVDRTLSTKGTLWQCSEKRYKKTGCYIDFMNQEAMAKLFQSARATLPAATYSVVYRNHCPSIAMPSLQVKGTATLEGVIYYTTGDGADPLTSDPAKYGYAEIPMRGCIDWSSMPRPVTVSTDQRVALDIIYFARDIAYAMEGSHISGGNGIDGLGRTNCRQGDRHALCVNALDLFGYDGPLSETVETYYVGLPEQASRAAFAQMHLAFDPLDRFVGGVTQVYFEQGSEVPWPAAFGIPPDQLGKNPFFMPILLFHAAEGRGYLLRTASSAYVFDAAKTYFVTFPHFRRGAHEGALESPIIENGGATYRVYPRSTGGSLP